MKSVINPDEAVRFANWLEEQVGNLAIDSRQAQESMLSLQPLWNDKKYDAYLRGFDESISMVHDFCEQANAYSDYLRRKAALLSEYLNG